MQKNSITIRRKLLMPIILLTFAVLAVFGFVACADQFTEDDVIDLGYVHKVVFDYNGGVVNENSSITARFKDGSKVSEPGSKSSQLKAPTKEASSFKYWCVAQKDDDGNLLEDEDGNLVPGKVWNFKTDTLTEDITLVAQWWDNYKMILHYGNDYELERIVSVSRDVAGDPVDLSSVSFRDVDNEYTFFEYYSNEAKTDKLESVPVSFTKDEYESQPDNTIHIWGKSLFGTYTIIRSANDLVNLNFANGTNIYLDASFDISTATSDKKLSFPENYNGEFVGNGNTISGITLDLKPDNINSRNFGLFKALNLRANIHDVKFENVTLNIKLDNSFVTQYNVGLLAGRAVAGAKVTNVAISGTLNYEISVGYDANKVSADAVIGDIQSGVELSNVDTDGIVVNGTTAAYTKDNDYAIYVKYTQSGSSDPVVTEVYGIASVDSSNKHTRIAHSTVNNDGEKYVITANSGTVYTVSLVYTNGYFESTVEVTPNA